MDDNGAPVDAAGSSEPQQPQPTEIADQTQAPGDSSSPRPDPKAEDTEGGKKPKSDVEKRINKLVGERLERDRRIAQLTRDLEQARAPREQPAAQAQSDGEPKESDYTDYSKYIEDRAAWRAEKAAEAKFRSWQESEAKTRSQAQAAEQLHSQQREFLTQVETLAAETPDAMEAIRGVAGQIDMDKPLGQALMQSDKGAALAYYLASHPADLARLDAIGNPVRAAIEIARLESKAEAHIQTRTRSSAPPQSKPLGSGGRGSTTFNPHDPNVSMKDWVAKRREQEYGKR